MYLVEIQFVNAELIKYFPEINEVMKYITKSSFDSISLVIVTLSPLFDSVSTFQFQMVPSTAESSNPNANMLSVCIERSIVIKTCKPRFGVQIIRE